MAKKLQTRSRRPVGSTYVDYVIYYVDHYDVLCRLCRTVIITVLALYYILCISSRWQVEENYCLRVKNTKQYAMKSSPRLLDLVDAAIFDFLLDNGDRHHYEVPANLSPASVFLFDNGKRYIH